jgi:hypothetical protein
MTDKEACMKKVTLAIALALLFSSSGLPQTAASPKNSNQDLALLRKDVQSQKKQIVAANLTLTDAEAVKFWPVYDQYSGELNKVNDTRLGLIKEYAAAYPNVNDAQAQSIVQRWLQTDEAEAQLRSKYMPMIGKVLPGKKTARFFQIDRRLGVLIAVQVTSEVPLVP